MTAATLTAPPTCDRARIAQARRALADANRTRMQKASIKRDVREGVITLAQITAQRPASLRATPLFVLLLELPGFGRRRLDKLNRRAIADGINLARTLGDASASTLDWLVRTVDGQPDDATTSEAVEEQADDNGATSEAVDAQADDNGATSEAVDAQADDNGATSEAPAGVGHESPAQGAQRRLLAGVVGSYHAADEGRRRRLMLRAGDDGAPVLVDRGGNDERVVERFRATSGLLEVAAVARGYLDEARALGRPVVAPGDPTAPTQCNADETDPRE